MARYRTRLCLKSAARRSISTFRSCPITDRIQALELFHGPTLAFKDVGARFMSRCLQYFLRGNAEKTLVIVATSGDTGGAVAAGFHGVEGVEVIILYPKGKVSKVQELQLTTLGGNVTTLELHGNFDECQALAKQALGGRGLQSRVHLTSANSINVARWLPQQFYYFYALKQLGRRTARDLGAERQFWQSRLRHPGSYFRPAGGEIHCGVQR